MYVGGGRGGVALHEPQGREAGHGGRGILALRLL